MTAFQLINENIDSIEIEIWNGNSCYVQKEHDSLDRFDSNTPDEEMKILIIPKLNHKVFQIQKDAERDRNGSVIYVRLPFNAPYFPTSSSIKFINFLKN